MEALLSFRKVMMGKQLTGRSAEHFLDYKTGTGVRSPVACCITAGIRKRCYAAASIQHHPGLDSECLLIDNATECVPLNLDFHSRTISYIAGSGTNQPDHAAGVLTRGPRTQIGECARRRHKRRVNIEYNDTIEPFGQSVKGPCLFGVGNTVSARTDPSIGCEGGLSNALDDSLFYQMPCSQRSAREELQLHTVVGARLRAPIILDFESGSLRYLTPETDTASSIVTHASAVNIWNVHNGVDARLPLQYNVSSTSAGTGFAHTSSQDLEKG